MAGIQGPTGYYKDGSAVLSEVGRLRIAVDEEISYLNIDKNMLFFLMNKMKKQSVKRMKHQWQTQDRKKDTVAVIACGGDWDGVGGGVSGTFTVSTDDIFLFAESDIFMVPEGSTSRTMYITSVNQSTGVIAAKTVDEANIDFNDAKFEDTDLFLVSNSFESGSGVGTIKSEQPSLEYNYCQIVQTPIGVTTTAEHLDYRGMKEFDKQKLEAGIDHAFKIEKNMFFGQRDRKATGWMDGVYEQWFMGGLMQYLSTNVDSQAQLLQSEFNEWMIKWTKYAKNPILFAGELIFEALTFWADTKLELQRNETTLGMAVSKYLTPYGKVVTLIPYRELLTGGVWGGWAFGIDLADIEYRFLEGLDTHIEVDVQAKGTKQRIDEFRTWPSLKLGNEKRHGLLKDVTTIAA
jgi:hypothetical protein